MNERSVRTARWRWGDLFSADVPDTWNVQEGEGIIEMTPSLPVGALHITFLRRSIPDDVRSGEAESLLNRFGEGRRGRLESEGERRQGSIWVATGSVLENSERGGPMMWDVQARVWQGGAIVCSYCHDGQHTTERREALSIMDSLTPQLVT